MSCNIGSHSMNFTFCFKTSGTRTCFAFCSQKESRWKCKVEKVKRRGMYDDYREKNLNPNTTDCMFAVKLLKKLYRSPRNCTSWLFKIHRSRMSLLFWSTEEFIHHWVFNARMLLPLCKSTPALCIALTPCYWLSSPNWGKLAVRNFYYHPNAGRQTSKCCSVGLEPF